MKTKYIPMLKPIFLENDKVDFECIEAIPIEYILNHYEVNNLEQNKALDELIESWRKDNER